MNLQDLKNKLLSIKKIGFVKTHRKGDTGIGKTLEDLLGIDENNLMLPDLGNIELKAKRIKSESMLTIATKSPLPKGANKLLFEKYKYKDKKGCFCLHSTVYGSRKNPQGLQTIFKNNRLVLKNEHNIEIFWPFSTFSKVLKAKSDKILLVFAKTRGKQKTLKEAFHYIEAYLLSDLNQDKFKSAVKHNKLKIDIRIGVYRSGKNKGKYHDHGTGFRISKRDFLHIFDKYEQII